MNKISTVLITMAAMLSTATFLSSSKFPEEEIPSFIHSSFAKWTKQHKKAYKTPAEYNHRLKVFYKTYLRVNTLRGQSTFTLKLNKFSDLTRQELKAKYTGYRPDFSRERVYLQNGNPLQANPKQVDWRNHNLVLPVKNQKDCGSCWAFGATAALEFAYANSGGKLTAFSEQQLVDCSSKYGNYGCEGGFTDATFDYIKDNGVVREVDYPYEAKMKACRVAEEKIVTKLKRRVNVKPKNGRALESAVAKRVVSVAVDSYELFYYNSGIMTARFCNYYQLDHAVSVVGYGRDKSLRKNYWIVRNSWGEDWGLGGYVLLEKNVRRRGVGTCGIRLDASYPIL